MKKTDIQIRDPFVLPVAATSDYFLFGTTDKNPWKGPGEGFNCYRSKDLEEWCGPIRAFCPGPGFWATTNFWAPEVHFFRDKYYMFASFKAPRHYRGTQILVADQPVGPYCPLTEGPVTPADWECLDGTLHLDPEGNPWVVFCHEWVQVHNGAVYAMRLSHDLKQALGKPVFLFNASEAPWGRKPEWPDEKTGRCFPTYITDGPFLFRTRDGSLLMLWSSFGRKDYAMGVARSKTGRVKGPWIQEEQPIWEEDGGHGMIFRTFDGHLLLTLHTPNKTPNERAMFFELEDTGGGIQVKKTDSRHDFTHG